MDQINLWPQATKTRRTVSWTRENEGEGACTDLWEAGSRLIYFHKSLRDVSANQPIRARLQSPGFPSLLGAVDVFSSEQCSCTPQIPARSLSAMVLKWMVIQIPALAACSSYPPPRGGQEKMLSWTRYMTLAPLPPPAPQQHLPHSRAQLLREICQKTDWFSA